MWEYEHSVETSATAEALWQHMSDVPTWPQWNDAIETVDIEGPFAVGTVITTTPKTPKTPASPKSPAGQKPVRVRLVDVKPGESFTDEMDASDFVVRTEHRLEPVTPTSAGLTRIVYRAEITGEAASHIAAELGPQITAGFPAELAALARQAEG